MVREPIRQTFFVSAYVIFGPKCQISELLYALHACMFRDVPGGYPIHPWMFKILLKVPDGSKNEKRESFRFVSALPRVVGYSASISSNQWEYGPFLSSLNPSFNLYKNAT